WLRKGSGKNSSELPEAAVSVPRGRRPGPGLELPQPGPHAQHRRRSHPDPAAAGRCTEPAQPAALAEPDRKSGRAEPDQRELRQGHGRDTELHALLHVRGQAELLTRIWIFERGRIFPGPFLMYAGQSAVAAESTARV